MRRQDNALYQRALRFLYHRTNYETFRSLPYEQMAQSLRLLQDFIDFIGNPDRLFTVVHVAGTKGKGTVCSALDRIYREAGYRVGLFTSPHLDELVERFQIDGKNCDKTIFAETLLSLIERWKEFIAKRKKTRDVAKDFSNLDSEKENEKARFTFFEWTFVLALALFARAEVDVAIIEVGMGGRFDATNAIDADVSVLTSVSFDHCDQLGDALPKIAAEKLGIVKTNAPLVCGVGFSNNLYGPELPVALAKHDAEVEEARRLELLAELDPNFVKITKPSPWVKADELGAEELARVARERCALVVDPKTTIAPNDIKALIEQARTRASLYDAPFYQIDSLSPFTASLPTPPFDSVRRWNFEIALKVVDVLANRSEFPTGRLDSQGRIVKRLQFPVSEEAIDKATINFEIPGRMEIVSTFPLVLVDGAHNRASVAAFMLALKERYPNQRIRIMFAPTYGKDVRGMLAEMIPEADEIILTERTGEARATPLPNLIEMAEQLLDEICEEDAPIRRKFRVVPDFRAFLADYCARPIPATEIMCAVGSFYFATEVRKVAQRR